MGIYIPLSGPDGSIKMFFLLAVQPAVYEGIAPLIRLYIMGIFARLAEERAGRISGGKGRLSLEAEFG